MTPKVAQLFCRLFHPRPTFFSQIKNRSAGGSSTCCLAWNAAVKVLKAEKKTKKNHDYETILRTIHVYIAAIPVPTASTNEKAHSLTQQYSNERSKRMPFVSHLLWICFAINAEFPIVEFAFECRWSTDNIPSFSNKTRFFCCTKFVFLMIYREIYSHFSICLLLFWHIFPIFLLLYNAYTCLLYLSFVINTGCNGWNCI